MNGWQAGVFAEYDLGYRASSFKPALMYAAPAHTSVSQRLRTGRDLCTGYSDTKLRVNTIRLPVNLLLPTRIDSKWKVFGGLGPYIGKIYRVRKRDGTRAMISTNAYVPGVRPIDNNPHFEKHVL